MKNYIKPVRSLILVLILASSAFAQDTTRSLAFKNNKPIRHSPYFHRPDLGYQIWQQFKLTQEANTGDVLAQHELGLRYLLGEGMSPDTIEAVYWIKKAANQNLASAQYNYAILLINGWGIDWDPFSAFNYFKKAARSGMIQAQYVIGILNTDNLIVKRDLNYAYYWINRSSSEGYEPASKIVDQLERKISHSKVDSIAAIEEGQISYNKDLSREDNTNLTSPVGLVFIDFESLGDSITS
ncbi:MAG: sel1 repeat family protein, partial [Bacteroidetes bacterium]|nr:sel1 repeat family protein [Bacteroidota bacterium]